MSTQKDPAVLFYIGAWLTSTAEMKADVRGWYLNLLLHNYDKGNLPSDIEDLAVLAGVKVSEFERFKHVMQNDLKTKFILDVETGRIFNPKADDVLKSREQFKEKRTRSGNIGVILKMAKSIKGYAKYIEQFKSDIYALNDEALEDVKNMDVIVSMFENYGLQPNQKNEVDLSFVAAEFSETFKKWLLHKKGKRENYQNIDSLIAAYRKLIKESGNDSIVAAAIIDKAIGNNYSGFFALNKSELEALSTKAGTNSKAERLIAQSERIKMQFKDESQQ